MHITTDSTTRTTNHALVMSAASLCLAVLMGFSALVRIPVPGSPVPLTLQTAVLFIGAGILRGGYALQMVAWYLTLGIAGAPFFAHGAGPSYLFGATGGYLVGFIVAAAIVGFAAPRTDRWQRALAIYLAAAAAIYVPGIVQLKLVTASTWSEAAHMGLFPFIAFDFLKAVGAFAVVRGIKHMRLCR